MLPIPKHSALVNMRYASFDAALRDARALVGVRRGLDRDGGQPGCLSLAQRRHHLGRRAGFLPGRATVRRHGVNLVEFVGDTEAEVEAPLRG